MVNEVIGMEVMLYTSPSCGPCKETVPTIKALANAFGFDLMETVLSEDTRDLFLKNSVRSVPTLMVSVKGRETGRLVGAKSKDQIETWLMKQGVRS